MGSFWNEIEPLYGFLCKEFGYRVHTEESLHIFDEASVLLISETLEVRINRDKGAIGIYIMPKCHPKERFGLSQFYHHIMKPKGAGDFPSSEQAHFLRRYHEDILTMLNDENFAKTREELTREHEEWLKVTFPRFHEQLHGKNRGDKKPS